MEFTVVIIIKKTCFPSSKGVVIVIVIIVVYFRIEIVFSQKVGIGNLIFTAEAEDADSEEAKRFEFSVGDLVQSDGNVLFGNSFFEINATTGAVTALIDPFTPGKYRLEVSNCCANISTNTNTVYSR